MSSFVTPENQKLIWDIIQRNPLVSSYFALHKNIRKEEWFRSIIERFYTQNIDTNLTEHQLHELNKTTISFMIQSIYQVNEKQQQPLQQQPLQQQPLQHISTPPIMVNNREQQYINEFERKKEEYDSMVRKDVPKQVQFQDTAKDTPINNMDSLIKKHIEEREHNIQSLHPIISQSEMTVNSNTNEKIDKLTQIIENLQQQVTDLNSQFSIFSTSYSQQPTHEYSLSNVDHRESTDVSNINPE